MIDTVDDLEPSGANALLKMLEEPPPNTLFFLVSHAPGRLLPTIRSRCRRLEFQALDDDAMTSLLEAQGPALSAAERQRVVAMSFGSAGQGACLRRAWPRQDRGCSARHSPSGRSDQCSPIRSRVGVGQEGRSRSLRGIPRSCTLADCAGSAELRGNRRERALDAYARARELAAAAPRVSLDPAATVFQMGGILAEVALQASASLKR